MVPECWNSCVFSEKTHGIKFRPYSCIAYITLMYVSRHKATVSLIDRRASWAKHAPPNVKHTHRMVHVKFTCFNYIFQLLQLKNIGWKKIRWNLLKKRKICWKTVEFPSKVQLLRGVSCVRYCTVEIRMINLPRTQKHNSSSASMMKRGGGKKLMMIRLIIDEICYGSRKHTWEWMIWDFSTLQAWRSGGGVGLRKNKTLTDFST